jgi:hypothetical protein
MDNQEVTFGQKVRLSTKMIDSMIDINDLLKDNFTHLVKSKRYQLTSDISVTYGDYFAFDYAQKDFVRVESRQEADVVDITLRAKVVKI